MSEAHATCSKCKAEMSLQPVDPVCGEQGAVKVTFMQLPALVCANAHRRFATPEFPMQVLDRIAGVEMAKLPAGEKRGLIFKHYHCAACGEKLGDSDGNTGTFDFDLTLKGVVPAFRVELAMPVYRCPSCGKEQIHNLEEMQGLMPAAMARAFRAAGLKPEK